MANDTMNRRNFLGKALGATAALAIVPSVITCACDAFAESGNQPLGMITLDLSKTQFNKLKNVGGSIIYTPPSPNTSKVMVITRVDASTFSVLTAICTHKGCVVDAYDATTQRISCGCHGSQFKLDGSVITVAPSPLKSYQNAYDSGANTLTITDSTLDVIQNRIGVASLSNYPNPCGDATSVEISLEETIPVSIYIIDMSGKKLLGIYEGLLTQGKNTYTVATANIPNGSYYLVVATEKGSLTKGIQVLH